MTVINKSPFPKTDKMGRKVPDGEAKFIDKHEVETVVRDEKTGTASDDTFQAKNIPVTNYKRQSAMTYEQAAVDKVLRIHNNLAFDRKIIEYFSVTEAKMTEKEKSKREEIVMSMKDKMGDFKKKYGKRAKEVMYATATKMAMEGYDLSEAPMAKPMQQGTTPTVTPKPNAPAAGTSVKQANPPNVGSLDPIRKDPNVVRDGGVKNTAPAPSAPAATQTPVGLGGRDRPGAKGGYPTLSPEDNRSQEEIDMQQSQRPQGVASDIKRENILKYKGSAGAQAIQKANPSIINVNQIQVGQRIKVNGQDYTVKAGDTLDRIARKSSDAENNNQEMRTKLANEMSLEKAQAKPQAATSTPASPSRSAGGSSVPRSNPSPYAPRSPMYNDQSNAPIGRPPTFPTPPTNPGQGNPRDRGR
jgi:hypothetical protein